MGHKGQCDHLAAEGTLHQQRDTHRSAPRGVGAILDLAVTLLALREEQCERITHPEPQRA